MLIVQSETGARPKGIRDMRWQDIDTSGDLWRYTPATHKNRHREIDRCMKNSRAVYLTQAAQDALFEYQTIRPDPKNEYIFARWESNSFLRLERHWEKFTPELLAVLEKVTTHTEAAQLDPSARQTHSKNAQLFTYVQAAKELGVHWQTVRKWKKNRPQDMTQLKAFAKEPLRGNGLYSIASYAKAVERACDL